MSSYKPTSDEGEDGAGGASSSCSSPPATPTLHKRKTTTVPLNLQDSKDVDVEDGEPYDDDVASLIPQANDAVATKILQTRKPPPPRSRGMAEPATLAEDQPSGRQNQKEEEPKKIPFQQEPSPLSAFSSSQQQPQETNKNYEETKRPPRRRRPAPNNTTTNKNFHQEQDENTLSGPSLQSSFHRRLNSSIQSATDDEVVRQRGNENYNLHSKAQEGDDWRKDQDSQNERQAQYKDSNETLLNILQLQTPQQADASQNHFRHHSLLATNTSRRISSTSASAEATTGQASNALFNPHAKQKYTRTIHDEEESSSYEIPPPPSGGLEQMEHFSMPGAFRASSDPGYGSNLRVTRPNSLEDCESLTGASIHHHPSPTQPAPAMVLQVEASLVVEPRNDDDDDDDDDARPTRPDNPEESLMEEGEELSLAAARASLHRPMPWWSCCCCGKSKEAQ